MRTSPAALKRNWFGMQVASRVSTRAAGWFTWRLWFTPWRVEVSERAARRQEDWLRATTPILLATGDGTFAGFSAGKGPVVLLVHGWGERASSLGAFIDPLVRSGHRVIGIDLPGHGATGGGRQNLYDIAAAIRSVADHVGGVHAVIAHSIGGHATMIALRDGFEIDRAVLISPSSQLRGALDRFEVLLSLPPRAKAGLIRSIERRFGPNIWTDLAGPNLVRDLSVPALLFHDTEDPQVSLEDSTALVDAWLGAELVTTDGLGHGRILRDETVIEKALDFIGSSDPETRKELQHANG